MITVKEIEELGKKYNITFRYFHKDGNPKNPISLVVANYTNWKDIKKYYKKRPSRELIRFDLTGEKSWYSWYAYKKVEVLNGKDNWGRTPNQKGIGVITFPKSLDNISTWRVEDFLDGSTMNPFKLGRYEMCLQNKEDAELYLNLCLKIHQDMVDLQNNETFKACLNTYQENNKKIEEATQSNQEIAKKLQIIIQRKAKIDKDTDEV